MNYLLSPVRWVKDTRKEYQKPLARQGCDRFSLSLSLVSSFSLVSSKRPYFFPTLSPPLSLFHTNFATPPFPRARANHLSDLYRKKNLFHRRFFIISPDNFRLENLRPNSSLDRTRIPIGWIRSTVTVVSCRGDRVYVPGVLREED